MPRNKTTFIDLLVELPWWASVLLAATAYVMMAHVLPSIQTDNQIAAMVFKAFVIPVPYIAGMILLAAPFAFLNARPHARLACKEKYCAYEEHKRPTANIYLFLKE